MAGAFTWSGSIVCPLVLDNRGSFSFCESTRKHLGWKMLWFDLRYYTDIWYVTCVYDEVGYKLRYIVLDTLCQFECLSRRISINRFMLRLSVNRKLTANSHIFFNRTIHIACDTYICDITKRGFCNCSFAVYFRFYYNKLC